MYKKILVAVDVATPLTTEALCKAANTMAESFDAQVQLISVVPDYGTPLVASFFPENAQDQIKEEVRSKLNTIAEEHFDRKVKCAVVQGAKRSQAIFIAVDDSEPDLVMLGCRRKHSRNSERLLGSTTMAVTDRAQCSVMVIRR